MDYSDIYMDDGMFYNFANEFEGHVKINQFKRISDTTISWIEHPHLCNGRTPNIFIELVFDEKNAPVFNLIVKFSNGIVCNRTLASATDAIDYVNNAIDSARIRKQYRDKIWSRYGF